MIVGVYKKGNDLVVAFEESDYNFVIVSEEYGLSPADTFDNRESWTKLYEKEEV